MYKQHLLRAVLLSAVLSFATTATADTEYSDWCNKADFPYDNSYPLAWPQLQTEVERRVNDFAIGDAYTIVINKYEQLKLLAISSGQLSANDSDINTLDRAIVEQKRRLDNGEPETPTAWKHTDGPRRGQQIQYDFSAFGMQGDDDFLSLTCADISGDKANEKSKIIAYFADTMNRTGTSKDLLVGQIGGSAVAVQNFEAHKNWIFNGLAQWPWELWANGSLVGDSLTEPPPDWQYVLMRPNPSFALRFDGTENSELDFALALEPIGFVRYKSRKYDKWWGLSALVTMTADNSVGYGALLRWNDFTIGTAYHDKSNDMLVYVNVDLFQFILGEDGRANQFDTFVKAASERVKEKQQESTPQ